MKLEDQLCSLESAKRLKELGCPQESLFYYVFVWGSCVIVRIEVMKNFEDNEVLSAYTVAELGEMLPEGYLWRCIKDDKSGKWRFASRELLETEAEARAKMLIHLIENGIVDRKVKI